MKKKQGAAQEATYEGHIKALRAAMISEEITGKLAQTFKVLGDPSRTKIIFALSKKELCVHEIALLLDMSQSAISHQLSILRHMELVKTRRDGRICYYALDDAHISNLFEEGIRHVQE
jgi:ArsR family transcriptional regulator, lead/cadmium/zinc/bismuth-responsive transcriptional repressor